MKLQEIEPYIEGISGYLLQYFISLDVHRFINEVDYFPDMIRDHIKWYLLHQCWYRKKVLLYGYIRRISMDYGYIMTIQILDILRLYHNAPCFDSNFDDMIDDNYTNKYVEKSKSITESWQTKLGMSWY